MEDKINNLGLIICRCGWCGCFCDNKGRVFKATRHLIAADNFLNIIRNIKTEERL